MSRHARRRPWWRQQGPSVLVVLVLVVAGWMVVATRDTGSLVRDTAGIGAAGGSGDGESGTARDTTPGEGDRSPTEPATPTETPSPSQAAPSPEARPGTGRGTGAQRPERSRPRARAPKAAAPPPNLVREPIVEPFGFRIGTYNIQGSQHRANGVGRAGTSAGIIMDRGVDVVGLQEVQRDQMAELDRRMGGYDFWPREALGRQGYRHQIAWRSSMFTFVEGGSVTYTFDNQQIPLPYLKLRHDGSGSEFWLINAHNSARDLEAQRDSATEIQIDLVQRLQGSGLPVFIVGDMNEKEEFFCKVAGATGMVAANGGSHDGGCRPPPGPLRVDWIMGSGAGFSDYVQDGASRSTGASDHYFIHADVGVAG